MKSKEISEVYEKHFRRIKRLYGNVLEDFELEVIHNFRLEMKRLRAFIRLMNLSSSHQEKIPKEIKSFYNLTGNIRNLQLHQQRIDGMCNDLLIERPSLYLNHLDKEEKLMRKTARELANSISFNEFEKKIIKAIPVELNRQNRESFLNKKQEELRAMIMLPSYDDESLHEVRKILKDLMYNRSFMKDIPVDLPAEWKNIRFVRALVSKLGDFHDLCIAGFLLGPLYVDRVTDSKEKESLAELRMQSALRKNNLKKEIENTFHTIRENMKRKSIVERTFEIM